MIARVENLIPKLLSLVRSRIDFEAVLARVARARDDCSHAVNLTLSEMVILNLFERSLGQLLKDAESVRALQGNLTVICADVLQLDHLMNVMRLDPIPILQGRSGIDDKKQMFG